MGARLLLAALCALLVLAHPETSHGLGPTGSVTVCTVSGSATAPDLAEVSVTVDQLAAFLNQNAGSFVGTCPPSGGSVDTSTGITGPVSAVATVCQVTGSADAPGLAQLDLAVGEVAAFVDRNPGSYVGTCPSMGGTGTGGPGGILGIPAGGALSICSVGADANALDVAQASVAIDRVAAYLNQNPGSYVGLCPSSTDPNGTIGNPPLGYITVCRVTGAVDTPLAAVTVRADELRVYLTQAGTVLDAASSGCPNPADRPAGPPSTVPVGRSSTVVVDTTPNTVVTATGAGESTSTTSNKRGRATVKVRPKRPGKIDIRGEQGRVVKTLGAASPRRSGGSLTG